MRRTLLAATILAAGAVLAWWLVPAGQGPEPEAPPPVAELAVPPPPPAPPPPAVTTVEVAGGAGSVLPVAAPDDLSLKPDGVKAALKFADDTRTDALLVWHRGALQIEHYGNGVRPFDRLDGNGLQQALMVLLAGRAVQDGTLPGIDTALSTWLPEWASDPRGGITVRQLLDGTSGLEAPDQPLTADAAAWTLSAPLTAAPESRFRPDPIETQVLALVLSRAAKQPLHQYMATAFWQPLGARPAEMQVGGQGGPYVQCCVKAAARDWLRLGLLMLNAGVVEGTQLVPTPWLDDMQRPRHYSRNDGWRVRTGWPFDRAGPVEAGEPFVEPDTVFLAGDGGQRLYVAKAQELVVLRMGPPVEGWDEARLPNLIARAVVPLPNAKRQAVSGKGSTELPPITKPPPVPAVEVTPLEPMKDAGG